MERSIASIRAARPKIDRAILDAATDDDVRRQAEEDGDAPAGDSTAWRLVVHPTRLRERLGLSREAFADALGIPAALVEDWDAGRILPDAAARSLLAAASREPETVFRLIAGRAA